MPLLRRWFDDSELARRLSFPDDAWCAYVMCGGEASCWVAVNGGDPVARFQLGARPGEPAFIDIGLRPDLRGQGLGPHWLRAFLDGPARGHDHIIGFIEPDNRASLRCFAACGFTFAEDVDADGMIRAEWRR